MQLKIFNILVIIVVMTLMLSGCAKQAYEVQDTADKEIQEESISEDTEAQEGDEYLTSMAIKAYGDLGKEFNDMLKPMLENIFGGAKLVMCYYSGEKNVVLDYVIKHPTNQDNIQAVVSAMNAQGYSKIMDLIEAEDYLVQMTKAADSESELSSVIGIEGNFNEQHITFSVVLMDE